MASNWTVLANAARAHVCTRDPADGHLTELAEFVHPQSRLKGRALANDRPVHVQKGSSIPLDPHTEPHHKAHGQFARELAAQLEQAVMQGRCSGWVLLASNAFLGTLKAHLGAATARALLASHPADLSAFEGPELARHVAEVLRFKP